MNGPEETWSLDLRPLRVEAGGGAIQRLPELVARHRARRLLLVTDEGIREAGHVDRVLEILLSADPELEVQIFAGVEENPTEAHVAAGVEQAGSLQPDLLVGLGGGSAMDCAKGINFLHTNGGRMEDYWGFGRATAPMLPSIGIPCSTGTGSEAQSFALISRVSDHVKMACGDEKARFRSVILDPDLASTQPRDVFALTAIDAISHAVEAYVTRNRNPFSRAYARSAWRLLTRGIPVVHRSERSSIPAVWADLLAGAHLAGAAIETSMLGAAHALANPLTARTGLGHGAAVGLMLPTVVRWNAELEAELYEGLDPPDEENGDPGGGAEAVARWIETWSRELGLGEAWAAVTMPEEGLGDLAAEAAEQWTARHNPRSVSAEDALELYRRALAGAERPVAAERAG